MFANPGPKNMPESEDKEYSWENLSEEEKEEHRIKANQLMESIKANEDWKFFLSDEDVEDGPSLGWSNPAKKQDRKVVNRKVTSHKDWIKVNEHIDNPEAFITAVRNQIKEPWEYFGFNLGEAISQGYLGLLRAARTYDSDKGIKFETWAWNNVKWKLLDLKEKNVRGYYAVKLYLGMPEDKKEELAKKQKSLQLKYKENYRGDDFESESDLGRKEEIVDKADENPFRFIKDDCEKEYKLYPEGYLLFLNSLNKLKEKMGETYHKIWVNSRFGKSYREIEKMDGIDVSYRTVGRYKRKADEKMTEYLGIEL